MNLGTHRRIDLLELGRSTVHCAWLFCLFEESGPQEIEYRAWLPCRGSDSVLAAMGPQLVEAERRGLRDTVRVDPALHITHTCTGDVRANH